MRDLLALPWPQGSRVHQGYTFQIPVQIPTYYLYKHLEPHTALEGGVNGGGG